VESRVFGRLKLTVRSWLSRWRASRWTRRGRRLLERGEVLAAVGALQVALRHRPSSFPALLLLSRAYLRSRDFFRARGALAQARETDRVRFEADAPRAVALEGFDLAGLCPQAPAQAATTVMVASPPRRRDGPAPQLPYGDCRDLDEYARFRAMPPVAPGEIDDWDAVLADLLDD
jgi:hypothetical protein